MADLKRYINPPSEQEKARGRKQTRIGIFTGIATLFASGGLFAFLDYKVTDGEYTAQIKSAIMSLIDDIKSLWQYIYSIIFDTTTLAIAGIIVAHVLVTKYTPASTNKLREAMYMCYSRHRVGWYNEMVKSIVWYVIYRLVTIIGLVLFYIFVIYAMEVNPVVFMVIFGIFLLTIGIDVVLYFHSEMKCKDAYGESEILTEEDCQLRDAIVKHIADMEVVYEDVSDDKLKSDWARILAPTLYKLNKSRSRWIAQNVSELDEIDYKSLASSKSTNRGPRTVLGHLMPDTDSVRTPAMYKAHLEKDIEIIHLPDGENGEKRARLKLKDRRIKRELTTLEK